MRRIAYCWLPVFLLAVILAGPVRAVRADESSAEAEQPEGAEPSEHAEHEDGGGHDHGDGDHDDSEHASDGHGEEHHAESGVPINFQADLALWSAVVFVLFLFVLKQAAWKPMIAGLDQRESNIRTMIADTEANQRKSQALLAEYEDKLRAAEQTVADMVAEARQDAERTSQEIVSKAEADVEAMRHRATEDIAQAKDAALAEVFTSVNSQVAAATERVLGRALDDSDQERLIQEALAEISG